MGLERQVSKKPAGIRTLILIALGSMLFVKYSIIASQDLLAQNADPARVMGQVVTGIGFLGAGTIMNREGFVAGLTTAATIWVQAAIGAIVALGYYVDAFIFSCVCIFILRGVSGLEIKLKLAKKVEGLGRVREGVYKHYNYRSHLERLAERKSKMKNKDKKEQEPNNDEDEEIGKVSY